MSHLELHQATEAAHQVGAQLLQAGYGQHAVLVHLALRLERPAQAVDGVQPLREQRERVLRGQQPAASACDVARGLLALVALAAHRVQHALLLRQHQLREETRTPKPGSGQSTAY